MRRDPSLASVSSFLSTVCGGALKDKNVKKKEEAKSRVAESKTGTIPSSTQTRSDARYIERQRLTRITAAKSLLEEELAKAKPSLASIDTFRAAAYGVDRSGEMEAFSECLATVKALIIMCDTTNTANSLTTVVQVPDQEVIRESETPMEGQGEAGIVVSDDAAMSIGDSEEKEEGSDEFSHSGSSSSRGESTQSRGSRKRPADE